MIHRRKNYSKQDPTCDNGDMFEGCNLTQATPNTAICIGKTGLVFESCNLVNCIVPADAVVRDCNINQVEFDAVIDTVKIDDETFEMKVAARIVGRGVKA